MALVQPPPWPPPPLDDGVDSRLASCAAAAGAPSGWSAGAAISERKEADAMLCTRLSRLDADGDDTIDAAVVVATAELALAPAAPGERVLSLGSSALPPDDDERPLAFFHCCTKGRDRRAQP